MLVQNSTDFENNCKLVAITLINLTKYLLPPHSLSPPHRFPNSS